MTTDNIIRPPHPWQKPAKAAPSMLATALDYAARGISVFPCNAAKKPLTAHGFKDATCEPKTITNWWTSWPSALIATPTGKQFDVLDLDSRVSHCWISNHQINCAFGTGTAKTPERNWIAGLLLLRNITN